MDNSMKYSKGGSVAGVVGNYSYEKLREEAIRGLYKENLRVQIWTVALLALLT